MWWRREQKQKHVKTMTDPKRKKRTENGNDKNSIEYRLLTYSLPINIQVVIKFVVFKFTVYCKPLSLILVNKNCCFSKYKLLSN